MANVFYMKITGFSYWLASRISHASTKHKSRVFQSLGGTKGGLLISFPCLCCTSSSFHNYIDNMSRKTYTPLKFQRRPPGNIQVSTKPPSMRENPWNLPLYHSPILYQSDDDVQQQWLDGDYPQFTVIEVNLNFQNDKVDPPRGTIPHISTYLCTNPNIEPYHLLGIYQNEVSSAWTEVWTGTSCSRSSIMGPRGRFVEIFEILGGSWYL